MVNACWERSWSVCVRLVVVRSRNPVSWSVHSIYLRSELTHRYKFLSARCPLADVLGSACGTPPPRHLGLTVCYLNRDAVEAWIEKCKAYSSVPCLSPATLTLPGKIVTRYSVSTSLGLLWKCIYADADGPNYDLRQSSSCWVR